MATHSPETAPLRARGDLLPGEGPPELRPRDTCGSGKGTQGGDSLVQLGVRARPRPEVAVLSALRGWG